jgi:putative copper export protein
MADPPPSPDLGDDTADRRSATARSRWVRVLAIALAIGLVVLVVVLHLTGTLGPGDH